MANAFIITATHWSNPGCPTRVALSREAADIAAAAFVNDLVVEFYQTPYEGNRDASPFVPVAAATAADWQRTLQRLQLARLVDAFDDIETASDQLGSTLSPHQIECPPSDRTLELVDHYVDDDQRLNIDSQVGFPIVTVVEVELVSEGN